MNAQWTPWATLEGAAARRIRAAFERGHGAGLLHLGAAEARTALPPVLAFWRDLGRAFVTALCALPDLEERRVRAEAAAPAARRRRARGLLGRRPAIAATVAPAQADS